MALRPDDKREMQRLPPRRLHRLRPGDNLRWDQAEAAHVAALQPVGGRVPEEAERAGGVFAQAGGGANVEVVLVAAQPHPGGEEIVAAQVERTTRRVDPEAVDLLARGRVERDVGEGETSPFTIHHSPFIIENGEW